MRLSLPRIPACAAALSIFAAALQFTACVFGNGDAPAAQDGPRPAPSARCADLTPEQQRRGDALVAQAQALQAGDVRRLTARGDSLAGAPDERSTRAALELYNQALAAAPGHCAAILGRALAQASLLIEDGGANQAVAALEKSSGARPLAKAFKASNGDAPALVASLALAAQGAPKPFITAQQDHIANDILPVLDSVIAALDAALKAGDFSVDFPRGDGTVVQIDAGEIGPALGGLKVVKAVVLILVGVQWEFAQDGSYAWMDKVGNLNDRDLANLSADQRAALDQLKSLFAVGSPFTRVKPGWKESIHGIPALLLEAVENAQAGLRYAKSEMTIPGSQDHDVYRVGTGEGDDVDPADIDKAIDALERAKKYLRGEVAMEYHGFDALPNHTLRVDFPKIFAWDGLQNFLPYYTVRPYEQWAFPDTASWAQPAYWAGYLGGDAARKVMQDLDLPADYMNITAKFDGSGWEVRSQQEWSIDSAGFGRVYYELSPEAGDACALHYVQHASIDRVRPDGNDGAFATTEKTSEGTIRLGAYCRVENGAASYLVSGPSVDLRPFYFTDAQGNKTMEVEEFSQAIFGSHAETLTGKIVFRDPTFGGVFPDLTNGNIWYTLDALDHVKSGVDTICETSADNQTRCHPDLPQSPTDLDYWDYYLRGIFLGPVF